MSCVPLCLPIGVHTTAIWLLNQTSGAFHCARSSWLWGCGGNSRGASEHTAAIWLLNQTIGAFDCARSSRLWGCGGNSRGGSKHTTAVWLLNQTSGTLQGANCRKLNARAIDRTQN